MYIFVCTKTYVSRMFCQLERVSAAIARGKRPVPFRTRKLSLSASMVLQGGPCGRVDRRRTSFIKSAQRCIRKIAMRALFSFLNMVDLYMSYLHRDLLSTDFEVTHMSSLLNEKIDYDKKEC